MKTMALTIFKLCVFVSFIASNNYADSADSLEGIKSAKDVADDSVPMLKRGAIGSGRRLSIDSLALKPQLVERLDGSDYRDRNDNLILQERQKQQRYLPGIPVSALPTSNLPNFPNFPWGTSVPGVPFPTLPTQGGNSCMVLVGGLFISGQRPSPGQSSCSTLLGTFTQQQEQQQQSLQQNLGFGAFPLPSTTNNNCIHQISANSQPECIQHLPNCIIMGTPGTGFGLIGTGMNMPTPFSPFSGIASTPSFGGISPTASVQNPVQNTNPSTNLPTTSNGQQWPHVFGSVMGSGQVKK